MEKALDQWDTICFDIIMKNRREDNKLQNAFTSKYLPYFSSSWKCTLLSTANGTFVLKIVGFEFPLKANEICEN